MAVRATSGRRTRPRRVASCVAACIWCVFEITRDCMYGNIARSGSKVLTPSVPQKFAWRLAYIELNEEICEKIEQLCREK